MIQRIQSIWFLLAALTASTLLFIPLASSQLPEVSYFINGRGLFEVTGDKTTNIASNSSFLLAIIILIGLYVFAIFQYKKRPFQKALGLLANFLALGIAYWSTELVKTIPGTADTKNMEPGLFIPAIAIVFSLLAVRAIKRDENLLKSADRLR